MHLKGALHVHTTCSDGVLSVAETIAAHEAQGFDFICLTDHDFIMRPGCYEAVKEVKTEMLVFLGVELMYFERGYVHISRIQGDRETLTIFNHPSELLLPLKKVLQRIEAVNRVVSLDAVEITSRGYYTPEYDIREIMFPKVATDDSHEPHMIGRAWVEMDAKRSKDEIIAAIKAGDFWNCFLDKAARRR
ncbi:MAG: PHP domain-containing protein [Thermodesulfobacteriota bacterium]